MKKIIFLLLAVLAFGSDLINPFETNTSENNSTSVDIPTPFDMLNKSENNTALITDNNITEINKSVIDNKTNETNATASLQENNISKTNIQTEDFKDSFKTLSPDIKIAVVIDKIFFRKYLSSIINSLNSYFLYKNVNFTIQVFDENNLTKALNYKYIIFYAVNPDTVTSLINFKNNFYLPIINKNNIETNNSNIYFGGINYKDQINNFIKFIQPAKRIIIINSNTYISNRLYKLETKEFNATVMQYQNIDYNELNNSYIIFNTAASKTAQILSNINYKNITPDLEFSAQINYDPLLIEITQPQDVGKLIIASSIINVPSVLEDYNQLLNSDIEFNWLNYSSTLLANKIYNQVTGNGEFYLNDFKLYMFDNQINYKTKLYQIIDNSFRVIY